MRGPLVIREGTVADALSLSSRLRIADLREIILTAGPDVERTLVASVECSVECWAAEEHGVVIALGGLSMASSDVPIGIPWLLGSDEVLKYPIRLVKEGRLAVARWESLCEVLTNMVHRDNRVHIEWLKKIGFSLGPTVPEWGEGKAPFIQFYRYSPPCANQQP